MIESELIIFGNAIKQEKIKKELRLTHFQRQLFRLSPLEKTAGPTTTISVKRKKKRPLDAPLSNNNSSKAKKKEDRLRDLLTTPVDVKKRKQVAALDKRLIEMSSRSVTLSEDHVHTQNIKPRIENIFSSMEATFLDVSDLIPYLSKAYFNLYGQHLNNLKEISTQMQPFEQRVIMESSRPLLEVRGIVQFQLSRDESQDF